MSEVLSDHTEGNMPLEESQVRSVGKVTILEALAEESSLTSADMSHRSTQMGNGTDAEDD